MNAKLFVAWTVISCLMQLTMGLKVENNQDLEATFTRIKRSLVHQDIFEINPQITERAKPGHGNDGDDDNKECPSCFIVTYQISSVPNFPSVIHLQECVNVKMVLEAMIALNLYVDL